MQDIHSVGSGGGAGRLFAGGTTGDRRLRPHHHQQGLGPQALKCPRCESSNTKFCYYNNYNLSQPRHFCKSCRRYWTKGGVLRNVPVGGGCRKTKRSKPKSTTKNPSSDAGDRKSSSQNSSSESSSLTATTTTAATTTAAVATATTAAAVPVTTPAATEEVVKFNETSTGFFTNPSFEPQMNNNIFAEIGTFTGLISSSGNSTPQLPLNFTGSTDISPFRFHHTGNIIGNSHVIHQQWIHTDDPTTTTTTRDELKVPEPGPIGFMDVNSATNEFCGLLHEKTMGTEDWNNGTDQGLFDLTGTVDQSYWSQTQWDDDHDHGNNNQLNYLP